MKIFKTLIIITLFVTAGTSAQSVTAKWPAMKTYDEVITRINNGVEQGNLEAIPAFSGTLNSFGTALTKSEVPNEFKSKKIQDAVVKLQTQTQRLYDQSTTNATGANLKPLYLETYATFEDIKLLMAEAAK